MPTQSTTYNTRLTDETLEARFRETFRSQGGAELVDDLYASGVIVPIVDFTSAAEGSALREDLQRAWDFSTGLTTVANTTTTMISTPGFWKLDLEYSAIVATTSGQFMSITLSDGLSTKTVWRQGVPSNATVTQAVSGSNEFVVFLRSGDSLSATSSRPDLILDVWYRQIADVSGNLENPTGFSFS